MPSVDENAAVWDTSWEWSREGEEWSDWWGGSRPMWLAALQPRIDPYLPAGTMLEIAPGYGRWTQYLKQHCDRLIVVDLAERCLEHCRNRFADAPHIEYHLNDGRSLEMIEDESLDFVFSFDSLVHVESDALDAYLSQLARKLRPNGVGFIHHSNIGRYRMLTSAARRVPTRLLDRLIARGLVIDIVAWRAESVTADWFAETCRRHGLSCLTQEMISWEHGPYLMDAISTFTPQGSSWEQPFETLKNPLFGAEGRRMKRLYAPSTPVG